MTGQSTGKCRGCKRFVIRPPLCYDCARLANPKLPERTIQREKRVARGPFGAEIHTDATTTSEPEEA